MAESPASHLSPADAAVAMRTWPRRYRAAFAALPDGESEELAARLGPDGVSALDLVVDSVRTWVLLRRALHDIRISEQPTLHPAVIDSASRSWNSGFGETLESALAQIDDASLAIAVSIEEMPSPDWARTALIAGGSSTDALSVAREAVQVGAENLKAIERTLSAVQ